MILVFGILGLVLCFPFGIAAWIMGSGDLRQMDRGLMDPSGRALTQSGQIIGIVATVLAAVAIVGGIALMVLGIGFSTLSPH